MRLTRRGWTALLTIAFGGAFLLGLLTANWNWYGP
jgi:hypothetical protein